MLLELLVTLAGAGLAGLGGVIVYGGVQQLRFNRSVESVTERSVADIAADAEGEFAYVAGTVEAADETVAAPFTGTDCVAYQAAVQYYDTSSDRSSGDGWDDRHVESRSRPFHVDDGSGAAGLDPAAADVDLTADHHHLVEPDDPLTGPYEEFLQEYDVFVFDDEGVADAHEIRFAERRLEPGDDVYATGIVGGSPEWGTDVRQSLRDGEDVSAPFVVADASIDSGEWTASGGLFATVFGLVFVGAGFALALLALQSVV